MYSLKNKNIIVTGASSGIGQACSLQISKQGGRVICLARDKEKLKSTIDILNGKNHKSFSLDLSDINGLKNFVRKELSEIKIDGIVHCAGISPTSPFLYSNPEKFDIAYKINVHAPYELTRLVIRFTPKSEMSIVFISSVMSIVGESAKSIYALTKGALVSLTKSLAVELSKKKIRVNCISPAVVETPLIKKSEYYKKEESLEKVREKHLLGLGSPEDIANSVLFLLSHHSKWTTGQNLVVDGGYTAI